MSELPKTPLIQKSLFALPVAAAGMTFGCWCVGWFVVGLVVSG
jgi:hypothetical protein